MEWHPAQLNWVQQFFVLTVLLPPIFVICGILAFLAPVLYTEKSSDEFADTQAATRRT